MPPSPYAAALADLESSRQVFSRQQALAAGVSAEATRWALASGRWTALRRGYYTSTARLHAASDDAAAHRIHVEAVLSRLECEAVVSHDSAAALHGLSLRRPPSTVTLTVARAHRRTIVGADIRTARDLSLHRMEVDGISCTTPARTAIDIARTRDLAETLVTADFAIREERVSLEDLSDVLRDLAGWPGIDQARQRLSLVEPDSPDAAHSWVRGLLLEQGLPAPRVDVRVGYDGRALGRYAFAWPEQRTLLALDPDGEAQQSLDGIRQARIRDERVRRVGYFVVTVAVEEVEADAPGLADRLREAFTEWQAA